MTDDPVPQAAEILRRELMKLGTFITVHDSLIIARRLHELWSQRHQDATGQTPDQLRARVRQRYEGVPPDIRCERRRGRDGYSARLQAVSIKGASWLAENLVMVVDDEVTISQEGLPEIAHKARVDGVVISDE